MLPLALMEAGEEVRREMEAQSTPRLDACQEVSHG
jgi:hypothetical protein